MKSLIKTLVVILAYSFTSCEKDNESKTIETYEISQELINGVSYKCITIGDQVWMAENLRTRLDGGRADGTMTFNEPFVTFASKESLELRRIAEAEIIKQWEAGFFNVNNTVNQESKLMIEELSGNFFNNTSQTWIDHVNWYDYWTDWQARYSRTTIDLVKNEVTRLFVEAKKIVLLNAADQDYLQTHGNLYTFEASKKVVPEGWRIPSDEDWMNLEKAMGMSDQDIRKKEEWRGNIGSLLKSNPLVDNFNATLGGAYIYGISENSNDNFKNKGLRGYWWTSTKDETAVDSTYYIRSLRFDNDQMLRGTTRTANTAYSIRLLKDK